MSTARRRVNSHGPAVSPPHATTSHRQSQGDEWEDELDILDDESERSSSAARRRGEIPRTPVKRAVARAKTPSRASPARPTRISTPVRDRRAAASKPTRTGSQSALLSALSMLFEVLLGLIRLLHTILAPVYPYLFLAGFALIVLSWASYGLINVIPPLLFRVPGHILRLILPSFGSISGSDVAIGQRMALIPLRTLATPACALTGQLCGLSFISKSSSWNLRRRAPEVDVGEVARSLVKEAKGAKDIFESIALLSGGGMMERLEYVK